MQTCLMVLKDCQLERSAVHCLASCNQQCPACSTMVETFRRAASACAPQRSAPVKATTACMRKCGWGTQGYQGTVFFPVQSTERVAGADAVHIVKDNRHCSMSLGATAAIHHVPCCLSELVW